MEARLARELSELLADLTELDEAQIDDFVDDALRHVRELSRFGPPVKPSTVRRDLEALRAAVDRVPPAARLWLWTSNSTPEVDEDGITWNRHAPDPLPALAQKIDNALVVLDDVITRRKQLVALDDVITRPPDTRRLFIVCTANVLFEKHKIIRKHNMDGPLYGFMAAIVKACDLRYCPRILAREAYDMAQRT